MNSAVDVSIEKLVYGGDGLARVDGRVLLAPFVLPGEQVRVVARPGKGGVLRGGRPEILLAAAERVVAECEYFGDCGGCQYQHAAYEYQLRQKAAILRETLRRVGQLTFDGEIPAAGGPPWNYRNRVQLHFANGRAGFHRAGSHALCAIDHCPISSPTLVEAIAKIAAAVKQPQWPPFLQSLELFTNERELQLTVLETGRPVAARFFEWCATFLPSLVPAAIEYEAAGHRFQISRGSFFQVNRFLIDELVRQTVGGLSGQHAADLYAGVGLFSIPLAAQFGRVSAVERSRAAFRDLKANTAAHANVKAANISAEQFLSELDTPPDAIVADPPRAGLGSEAVAQIQRLKPGHLAIVSCDPATLSRDLKQLLASYRIESIKLVDLFPQTYHFETLVHLTRI